MADFVIQPCGRISGVLRVPGDKSISHRLAMLCGLASGESVIRNYLMSEDCLNTLRAVEKLGAQVAQSGKEIRIVGTGGRYSQPAADLDMGNSGTGMRLMAGLLAGQSFVSRMTGDASLCSRPMNRIRVPLELMGADIQLLGAGGCAPIEIRGKGLKAIEYTLPMASAQVKSCVLLAGLGVKGRTVVIEPRPTRDHTEKLLTAMGVGLHVDGLKISLEGEGELTGGIWDVPGDFSSAAFWIAAAACSEGSDLTIEGVGLNPRRTAFLDVLKRMGADIRVAGDRGQRTGGRGQGVGGRQWEEVGSVRVRGCKLNGTEISGDEIPNLIDELPLVAVVGALARGRTVIKDAGELRVKESDRISSVAEGLSAFGVIVDEQPDGMVVVGDSVIKGGASIDSHGDHRIAMAMAVLGLFAESAVTIHNVACVDTSYPGFKDDMEKVVC